MLTVVFHPRALKELGKIPARDRVHVLEQIVFLERLDHPLRHRRAMKLAGRKTDDYRLRVGDWRIKFTLRDTIVLITAIDNRQRGY